MNFPESQLSNPVRRWLTDRNYTVHTEVFGHDLAGYFQERSVIVELKTSLTTGVIRQCLRAQTRANYVFAAVSTSPRKSGLSLASKYGIGVLRVAGGVVAMIVDATDKSWGESGKNFAKQMVNMKTSEADVGGLPCLEGRGPAQDCLKLVDEYRKSHPSATWREVFADVPNHYANPRSMAGAMSIKRMLLDRRAKEVIP